MRRAFFFIVALLSATSSFASLPRASMPDRASEHAPAAAEPLPETRVWASDVLAPFERPPETELTRALHQAYADLSTTNASGLGRFLSVDPGPGLMRKPQSWNRYAYVMNNPVGNIDPDGRCTITLSDGTIHQDANTVCVEVTAKDPGWTAEALRARAEQSADLAKADALARLDQIMFSLARPMLQLMDGLRRNDGGAVASSYASQLGAVGAGRLGLGILGLFRGGGQEESFFDGATFNTRGKTDKFHNFPEGVMAFERSGTVRTFIGGDGKTYQILEIAGAYGGRNGVFEFIKNSSNEITHYLFRPF